MFLLKKKRADTIENGVDGSTRSNKRREHYSYKGPIFESRKPEKILSRRKRESFSSFSDHRGQSRKKSLGSWRHDMRPCLPPCARCCSLCSLQRKRHFNFIRQTTKIFKQIHRLIHQLQPTN